MNQGMRRVAVLGATGSIGCNTADVLARFAGKFQVTALAARNNLAELARQAELLSPSVVATSDASFVAELRSLLPANCRAAGGEEALLEIAAAPETDILLCAIVGTAGIGPVLAAIEADKCVALASKEVLVSAGELVRDALRRHPKAQLIPVDSEHSGVFQALQGRRSDEVAKVILTASGGPFRSWPQEKIQNAQISDALAHPTWSMGRKITIDSASMMNKALELVEAKFLFNVTRKQLGVLVQPQSIVHAMVQLTDGSFIAQCAAADMRLPIAYALSYPERLEFPGRRLDWAEIGKLEFFAPDREKFPSFDFADAALDAGGTLPCAMNAANEVAVERFCSGEIPFGAIWTIVGKVMETWHNTAQGSPAQLAAADSEARARAREVKIV